MLTDTLFSDIKINDCLFHIDPYKYTSNKQHECKIQMFIIKDIDYENFKLFYIEGGKDKHELVKWHDLGVYDVNDLRVTTLDRTVALKALRLVNQGAFSKTLN